MIQRQHSAVCIKPLVDMAAIIVVETDFRRVRRCARRRCQQLNRYFRTSNHGATLIWTFLHRAILTDRFRERTDFQVAHQHSVVTRAIQTWFTCNDPIAFLIPLVVEVTSNGG